MPPCFSVESIENRLHGEEVQVLYDLRFFRRGAARVRASFPASSAWLTFARAASSAIASFIPALMSRSELLATLRDLVAVGKHELEVNDFDIADRVDFPVHMYDVRVIKEAHHLEDGVGLAY